MRGSGHRTAGQEEPSGRVRAPRSVGPAPTGRSGAGPALGRQSRARRLRTGPRCGSSRLRGWGEVPRPIRGRGGAGLHRACLRLVVSHYTSSWGRGGDRPGTARVGAGAEPGGRVSRSGAQVGARRRGVGCAWSGARARARRRCVLRRAGGGCAQVSRGWRCRSTRWVPRRRPFRDAPSPGGPELPGGGRAHPGEYRPGPSSESLPRVPHASGCDFLLKSTVMSLLTSVWLK